MTEQVNMPRTYTIKCLVDNVEHFIKTMYNKGYTFGSMKNEKIAIAHAPDGVVCSKIYPNNQFSLFPKSYKHLYDLGNAVEMDVDDIPKAVKATVNH